MKLIQCGGGAPTKPLTQRGHALRKRIKGTILLTAANEGTEIGEEEVKRRVYLEEATKKVRVHPASFVVLVDSALMSCC